MSDAVSVAIDMYGPVIRYAEVELRDGPARLLRLGSCDFDFNAAADLLGTDAPRHFDSVVSALQDAIGSTEASKLVVCVHPPDSYSFFTPISAELPVKKRREQLYQQAALLTGTRDPEGLDLTSKTVRTEQDSEGDAVMWVHVLAVPAAVDERIAALADALPVRDYQWVSSPEAAARVAGQTELTGITQEQALRPFTLSIGEYDSHTEYTLSRDRQWFHSHHTREADTPADRLYFAIGLLNRLDVPIRGVGRIFVYGQDPDLSAYKPFETIFGVPLESLDALAVLDANRDGFGPEFDSGSYAPSVGASIRNGQF
jgi:hypothetical protein